MCKLCLNTKLLFDKICFQANADDEELDYSMSDFLMTYGESDPSENWFYILKCIEQKSVN